ncbi:MAG: DUF3040 domain-containing protein, partial [bacterium]|nr:DUF3040 domain-containing protein [bacterium]
LEEIELGLLQEDAAFAQRIAGGPRLSARRKAALAAATVAGITLVMLFPVNLMLGVAGYLVLVIAGTSLLRQRPMTPADQSPLEAFHRLTAGLFRNTSTVTEPSLD